MRCYFILIFASALLLSCSGIHDTIKIKGSDTEVNLAVQLAESFHNINPGIFVSISGGGSGLGIASLLNGTGDVANSSRSITTEETDLFQKRGSQLDSFVFAQDAIAFVVADDFPLDSISIEGLTNVLAGHYKNWLPLTNTNLAVNIYGRQSNSGTHDFIKNKLGIDFTPYAKQMNGNAQILEAIKADNSGIGYVGAGYVANAGNNGIKVLLIYEGKNQPAVSPLDAAVIAAGKYYFQRPLYQYFIAASFNKIQPFIEFEKSEEGKKIIQSAGYYPVSKEP